MSSGIVLHMVKQGFRYALLGGFIFLIVRLLHIIGLFKWEPTEMRETAAIILSLFIVGCMSSFSSWDRLIEKHKEYSE